MSESAEAKGRRYLTEGRLTLRKVAAHQIDATCRGSGDIYELGYTRAGWSCGCPARGRCAHLVALQLVTVRGGAPR